MINLPHNWAPRHYQLEAWNAFQRLTNPGDKLKRAALCCHRRWGKDDIMLHHNACSAFERKGNYWYMLPEYSQCRKAIWNAINPHSGKKRIDEAFPHEIRSKTLENEMFIEFKNGSTWQLMGSDNYDSLVGAPPIGLTFSEYAISNPNSWEYLSPIMMENNGWAIFNSTARGKNHFYKTMNYAKTDPSWFHQVSTVADTDVFDDEMLLNELKRLQSIHGDDYGKAIWLQEYYCSFEAAIPGAIWGDSLTRLSNEGRVVSVPHTEGYPVFTAWDLGRSDMTAVWFFQVIGQRINVIDYYADNFKEIEDFANMLKKKVLERKYRFDIHWLPHDAKPKRLGMGGKGIIQQFFDNRERIKSESRIDIGTFRLCPNVSKEDGIQAARKTFQYAWFDNVRCMIGFDHLKSYHRKYDEDKHVFSTTAEHDEHSHPADAWRYLSLVWKFSKDQQVVMTPEQELMAGNIGNVTFGDLKKEHFRNKKRERASKL
jgi:phage terminase large subunit